jgi:hypothetical protein
MTGTSEKAFVFPNVNLHTESSTGRHLGTTGVAGQRCPAPPSGGLNVNAGVAGLRSSLK